MLTTVILKSHFHKRTVTDTNKTQHDILKTCLKKQCLECLVSDEKKGSVMGVYIPVTKKSNNMNHDTAKETKVAPYLNGYSLACWSNRQQVLQSCSLGPRPAVQKYRHQTCKYQQRLPQQRQSAERIGSLLQVREVAATCLATVAPRISVRTL